MLGHFGNNAIEMIKKRNSKPKQNNITLLKKFLKDELDNNNKLGEHKDNIQK